MINYGTLPAVPEGFYQLRGELMACGVGEIHGLLDPVNHTRKALDAAFLERVIEKADKGVVGTTAHRNALLRKRCLIATTTQNQEGAAAYLAELGFKEVHEFKNWNGGNAVKVWVGETDKIRVVLEKRAAEEKEKKKK